MATDVKRIAIIGAGLAGISALRRLSENKLFQLTCFERNFDIGGTWMPALKAFKY
jgi:cation diffusion facilitator CzcD-associated flavoprotein CzcO